MTTRSRRANLQRTPLEPTPASFRSDQPLRLVFGATGGGATPRSVELSQELDAPVVVLDRVQCIPALAIGSGRLPRAEAAAGAGRFYLAQRSLAQGPLPAADSVEYLTRLVGGLFAQGHPTVVLEGNSCSVLREITTRWGWSQGRDIAVEYIAAPDDELYRQQIQRRVEGMLGVADPMHRTMLDELGEGWADERHHQALEGIIGYREVLRYCAQQKLDPVHLMQRGHEHAPRLIIPMLRAHLYYGAAQRLCMGRVLPRFTDHACQVEVTMRNLARALPAVPRPRTPLGD